MYNYEWDKQTGGYHLMSRTGKFVACEIRPVFAEELALIGLGARLAFNPAERHPLVRSCKKDFL